MKEFISILCACSIFAVPVCAEVAESKVNRRSFAISCLNLYGEYMGVFVPNVVFYTSPFCDAVGDERFETAFGVGIVNGYEGCGRPKDSVTFEEAVVMMSNVAKSLWSEYEIKGKNGEVELDGGHKWSESSVAILHDIVGFDDEFFKRNASDLLTLEECTQMLQALAKKLPQLREAVRMENGIPLASEEMAQATLDGGEMDGACMTMGKIDTVFVLPVDENREVRKQIDLYSNEWTYTMTDISVGFGTQYYVDSKKDTIIDFPDKNSGEVVNMAQMY